MDNDLIQDTNLDLLQVNAVEVEYSGIAPINVDNQEHTISLDPSALSSKLDTSAFDEWTATHSAGEEYSAGEGIDITDHVISYTGDPGDATPWISGNKIITSADTMQPGEFIQVLSSFDLSGNKNHFITVKGQGYYFPTNQDLKERVGVDDYLPLSSFSSYTASIASNLENNWNYTNSAYSQSINNYYNKLDISAFSSWSSEHSGDYLTKESADTLYQPIGDYQTAGNYQTAGDYLSATDSALFYPMEGNPSGFLTGVDLSNYYEKNETSSKEEIENAFTSVENIINNLSGEYYPLTSNPSGFITGVDLSNYYQKNETSSKEEISDALTSKLDATSFDPNAFYPSSNPSGFITGVDLTDYVERDELTAYQEKGDYYSASNPSGFITGVDLSNYYEKNETSSKEEISAALTSKLDESAFTAYTANADVSEYTAGDNINITNHVVSGKDWTSTIESAVSSKLDITAFNSGAFYPMSGNPSGFLTGVDLSNYYEKNETSSKEEISAALENAGHEYSGIAPIDVNNTTYQISADVWTLSARNGIAILEDSENKVTTLDFTAQPDLSNYYTKTDIQNQSANYYPKTGNPSGFLTAHQSLSNYYTKNDTSSKTEISNALTGKQDKLTFAYNSSDAISSINGSALAGGSTEDTIDLSAGEGISIIETANKVLISNNISAGSNMSFVYDSETNKIRIDAADTFPISAIDGTATWSADCNASSFIIARNTSRTDIGAYGFEYRQAPSVDVSGTWYDLALLMEKFKYAIPVEAVANSGLATGQNILYVVTGS